MKRMLIRLAVLLPLAVLVYQVRHYVLNVRHSDLMNVQRVTLLNPPRPEPPKPPEPEPETKQQAVVEPPKDDTTHQFFKFDESAPNPAPGPGHAAGPPAGDMLGLDTKGGAGSDAFGLVGRPGGRDITTLGSEGAGGEGSGGPSGQGQGGPMAKFGPYAVRLRDAVTAELNSHAELRTANYDATVMIWLSPDGGIRRVAIARSTGVAKVDDAIRQALVKLPGTPLPPPSDMPQPIDLRIVSKGAS